MIKIHYNKYIVPFRPAGYPMISEVRFDSFYQTVKKYTSCR